MHQAAILWAKARQQGQAGDKALDGDVILAGQAWHYDARRFGCADRDNEYQPSVPLCTL